RRGPFALSADRSAHGGEQKIAEQVLQSAREFSYRKYKKSPAAHGPWGFYCYDAKECNPLSRIFDRSLCSGKAGNRYAERRAGDIGQACLVAELDGGRVAAVLAA